MSRSLLALLLLGLPLSAAAIPETLNSQGFLLDDATGEGLTGTVDLTFSLYLDAAATDAVWTETLAVEFTDGAYSAILGASTGAEISHELLEQSPLWLGLAVGTNAEMSPRQEVHSVPFALLTETAVNLKGGSVDATSIQGDSVTVGDTVIDADGISMDGSVIINGSGGFVGESPAPPDLGCENGELLGWDGSATPPSWACYALSEETDPVFDAAAASDISADHLGNWNDAYDWGDHGAEGYLTGVEDDTDYEGTRGVFDTDVGRWNRTSLKWFDPDDPPAAPISQGRVNQWDMAYAWGSHVDGGYMAVDELGLAQIDGQSLATGPMDWEMAWDFIQALDGFSLFNAGPDYGATIQNITASQHNNWNRGYAFWGNGQSSVGTLQGNFSVSGQVNAKSLDVNGMQVTSSDVASWNQAASAYDPSLTSWKFDVGPNPDVGAPLATALVLDTFADTTVMNNLFVLGYLSGAGNDMMFKPSDQTTALTLDTTGNATFGGHLMLGTATLDEAAVKRIRSSGERVLRGGTHILSGRLATASDQPTLLDDAFCLACLPLEDPLPNSSRQFALQIAWTDSLRGDDPNTACHDPGTFEVRKVAVSDGTPGDVLETWRPGAIAYAGAKLLHLDQFEISADTVSACRSSWGNTCGLYAKLPQNCSTGLLVAESLELKYWDVIQ